MSQFILVYHPVMVAHVFKPFILMSYPGQQSVFNFVKPFYRKKEQVTGRILKTLAKVQKFIYITYHTIGSLFVKQKIRILFSTNDKRGEKAIRGGFRFLPHELTFAALSYENLIKNDLIVPLSMQDLRVLISYPEIAAKNPIPTPSAQSVNICDDKYLFYQTLVEKGFENVMPKVGTNLRTPYMVKKKVAHQGLDCFIIDSPEKKEQYKNEINNPEFFCQEIVQGRREHATHLIYKDGKFVSSLNITYIFSSTTYVKGQDKFICTIITKCPHLDLFGKILDAIGFEGLCCFNYKEIDGKPYIFEINPRFGGSLTMFFFSFIKNLEFPANTSPAIVKANS